MEAKQIVTYGAGCMGLMSAAFAMRLTHLGFRSHVLDEPTTPAIGEGSFDSEFWIGQDPDDMRRCHSGQGGRRSACSHHSTSGFSNGQTGGCDRQALRADQDWGTNQAEDHQPMTALSDQSLLVLFDAVVLQLMEATHQTSEDLWARHRSLE